MLLPSAAARLQRGPGVCARDERCRKRVICRRVPCFLAYPVVTHSRYIWGAAISL